MRARLDRAAAALAALVFLAAPAAQAQMTGFTPNHAQAETALESILRQGTDTGVARNQVRALASAPHVAGTPAQTMTADFVLRAMASYGLDTSRVSYRVYIPYHDSTVVALVQPRPRRLNLTEGPLRDDPATQGRIWPAMNGYSGAGDVTAPAVFVNYGLPDDYALLDSMGVSVRGRVAVARYGRSYRGIKAREAEAHGAAALLLYSDPQDDGYFRGDVYPRGPMRPDEAVQRGSLKMGNGDASTPGWPSTDDARRLPADSMSVPHIPVVPLGYGNAALVLQPLAGPSVPQPWQGALPFRYHVGGTPDVTVRVAVWPERGERAYKTIVNTIATIPGREWPKELVLTGAHRDAWGPGAVDNVGGVVSVLQAARAWGEALKEGVRPRRTLVFATWDGEEWGLVGSTEWVEAESDALTGSAVAYLNQDVVAAGRDFGASGTASLQPLIVDATHVVQQPGDTVSVYQAWRARTVKTDTGEVHIGDLGGGSDFGGFYNHLGIPAVEFGFGGPYGVYHAAYDSYTYVSKFSDPGFLSHAAAGRLLAVLMARLANADVLPLDYAAFGGYLETLVARVQQDAETAGLPTDGFAALAAAAGRLTAAGRAFNQARQAALSGGSTPTASAQANASLRTVEQALTRPTGLANRAWMRNLIFASDRDNGYANVALPSLAEAIADHDAATLAREAADLAERVDAATARVEEARAALGE